MADTATRPSPSHASAPLPVAEGGAHGTQPATEASPLLPAPSMPKGGGAIKGLGEAMTFSPARGTGALAIPIAMSPGRAGVALNLALQYDTGAGNSAFGLGFDVPVPRISRKTSKGVPAYTDADTFVFSGADDLVPVVSGVVPPTEVIDGVPHRVEAFRPRIESAYARIERCTPQNGTEVFWRVTARDNVVSLFGRTEAGRIIAPADPGEPVRIFEWLLQRVTDDRGNVTVYEYKPEDLSGVDAAHVYERHRLDGPPPVGKYLKCVRYANGTPGVDDTRMQLVFDYGEHDLAPDEVHEWPVRPDAYSSYRAGFEVRTWRLCRRILMFHDFGTALGDGPLPRLVRATELTHAEQPVATKLTQVRHVGFEWSGSSYTSAARPPIVLGYTTSAADSTVRDVTVTGGSAPPVADATVTWVDLDGEGLPGMLTRTPGGWWYQRNEGEGRLAVPRVVNPMPAQADGVAPRLTDLDGDGRLSLVEYGPDRFGFVDRTTDGSWASFVPFRNTPAIDLKASTLRQVDLDGDGLGDLLIGGGSGLWWLPSLGRDGYGPPRWVSGAAGDEAGPQLAYVDEARVIFLADMSGDGLSDIVRIRNGEVCYWPSLGRGRFGAKVTMAGAPHFDHPERFDPARIRLADVDGTGPADLVYLGRDGVRCWLNQSGNALAPGQDLCPLPPVHQLASVDVLDLLGTGTACLVWSSPAPAAAAHTIRYVDLSRGTATGLPPTDRRLAGWKPHLLCQVDNSMGARHDLEYAPSTRFYLDDRRAGRPWASRLPFPVLVVAAHTLSEGVTGTSIHTTYAYRHGYFDGVEREFRGFGRTEVTDAQMFPGPPPGTPTWDQPPVRTINWFHLGSAIDVASERFTGDPAAIPLPDSDLSEAADGEQYRQALRALAGQPLRVEVYADDGVSEDPYTVVEHRYHVRRLQPPAASRPGVFFPFALETVSRHYERNPADPRIAHLVNVDVDGYGVVRSAVAIGYPRRAPAVAEQAATLATWTLTDVAHTDTATVHRIGVPIQTRIFDVTGLPTSGTDRLTLQQIVAALPGLTDIPYEQPASPNTPQRRLVEDVRTEYWSDDLSSALAPGQTGARALARRALRLAFTPGLLADVFGPRVTAAMLTTEGGYAQSGGLWWAPSAVTGYDPAQFYLPVSSTGVFGNVSTVAYDSFGLLVTSAQASTTAPFDVLTTSVVNDYRMLLPAVVTDPNGDQDLVRFDALGQVVAAWRRGHSGEGDPDPLPGAVFTYDLDSWRLNGTPVWTQADTRERHGDAGSPWQKARVYSDGIGRAVLTKIQAEPGQAWTLDGTGTAVLTDTTPAPRWVGTGRTVYNNKGLPVQQYEPYFTVDEAYDEDDALVKQGVTPTLHYDPLGRLIRTDHPDATITRVVFDPWQQVTWDRNDTVLESQWYAQRQGGGVPPEQARAATLTAAHAGTPTTDLTDTLGRTVRTGADNGPGGIAWTLAALDIEGNRLAVTDARGLIIQQTSYDLHNQIIHTAGPEAGERWVLPDANGAPIRGWDSRGFARRMTYDALRRPIALYVTDAGGERLTQATVYGEPRGPALRHRGRIAEIYDGAGHVVNDAFDFQGNVTRISRRLLADPTAVVAWPQALGAAADALLDPETFQGTAAFDALNRITQVVQPHSDQPGTPINVVQPGYNIANLLDRVDSWIGLSTEPVGLLAPGTATHPVITNLDYDAHGRCVSADYANGVHTIHDFDEASQRLRRVNTQRGADALQDLTYTYDAVGNVLAIADAAHDTVFHNNAAVGPGAQYTYDALYRLVAASGREHESAGQSGPDDSARFVAAAFPEDGQALRNYVETYDYDLAGNVLRMRHHLGSNLDAPGTVLWNRRYQYAIDSNRLLATSEPGDPVNPDTYVTTPTYTAPYDHDAHGNMRTMPHLMAMMWDDRDLLIGVDLGGGGIADYAHDAFGQRVRKVWRKMPGLVEERIYLGGVELFRRRTGIGGPITLERQTVTVTAGAERVAMIETRTIGSDPAPDQLMRYQLTDHLGSSMVEVDAVAAVISYEEYYPFGATAYQAARSATETPKRYRFTGRERDEESGLSVHGLRYYAPWLGRWTSCDPIGLGDGTNVYRYCRNNPLAHVDPGGTQGWPMTQAYPTPQVPRGGLADPTLATGTHLIRVDDKIAMIHEGRPVLVRPAPKEDTTPPSTDPGAAFPERPPDEGGQGGYFAAGVAYGVAQYEGTAGLMTQMPWEITGKHHDPQQEKEFMRGAAWGMMLASTRDMAKALSLATEAGFADSSSQNPVKRYVSGTKLTLGQHSAVGDMIMVEANALEVKATAGALAAGVLMKKAGGSGSAGPPPAPAKEDYRGRYNADRIAKGKKPLPAEYDAHHRIPQEYRGHPEFKGYDFDAPPNVRGVKGTRAQWAGKAAANYHQEITNWWAIFRQQFPNATRAQIEAFAVEIDKGYARYYFK